MNNKWLRAAIPAILLHISIGTVYCWSTFKADISDYIGADLKLIEWAFSIAVFTLGITAAFLGNFIEKNLKKSALTAAFMFAFGLFGTALSIKFKSIIGIYIFYGFVMGVGLGFGYMTPVKNLMLWFDKNKGLATGLAVTGFGLAKMIAAPVMQAMLKSMSLFLMFTILALFYFVIMLAAALLIKRPNGYAQAKKQSGQKKSVFLKNPIFIAIWVMFFLNITSGLAIISQEKDILTIVFTNANKSANYILSISAIIISVNAFFNAFGRIGVSSLSDKLKKRESALGLVFVVSLAAVFIAIMTNALQNGFAVFILLLMFVVNAGYGGGFSTVPVILEQKFGIENISTTYGLALSAWAFAGLFGNQLASLFINTLKLTYNYVFYLIGAMYLISLVLYYFVFIFKKNVDN